MKTDLMQFFPLATARGNQKLVIEEIARVFDSGKKIILLEAPVGSGKSPIALTLARAVENAHILTPRKSLQNQYYDDFSEYLALMKGRSSYPCTRGASSTIYNRVKNAILQGSVKAPPYGEANCAVAPCRDSREVFQQCTQSRPCPYTMAIDVAVASQSVVHNLHSFIFQTKFGEKFQPRELLIVDECHEIEGIIRDFVAKNFSSHKPVRESACPQSKDPADWYPLLLSDEFVPEESRLDEAKKREDKDYLSDRDRYIMKVEMFMANLEEYKTTFTVKFKENRSPAGFHTTSAIEFVPHSVGMMPQNLIFNYGEKVLLMSGTIYDKDVYCRSIGLDPKDVHFIRVPSSFPAKNRPIYMKPEYQVNTSFANWNDNFDEMIEKIKLIMSKFPDAKGLIHAPSYSSGRDIATALRSDRIVNHTADDFQERLNEFFESPRPDVFLSPVCQQGTDFKGDRARFQIIVRVPYLSTGDKFINEKMSADFSWYNYQALVIFGQQTGRVNRSDNDYGATFLLDSRFNRFVSSNGSKLPKWMKDAFIK